MALILSQKNLYKLVDGNKNFRAVINCKKNITVKSCDIQEIIKEKYTDDADETEHFYIFKLKNGMFVFFTVVLYMKSVTVHARTDLRYAEDLESLTRYGLSDDERWMLGF